MVVNYASFTKVATSILSVGQKNRDLSKRHLFAFGEAELPASLTFPKSF